MANIRFECLSCPCIFDPDTHYVVSGMEAYLECPDCGRRFMAPVICPNCAKPLDDPEDMGVTEEDLFFCYYCEHEWPPEVHWDDYWGDSLPSVQCPNCKKKEDLWNIEEKGYQEYLVCKSCGNKWPVQDWARQCPNCKVTVEPKTVNLEIDQGQFVCDTCGNRWPTDRYWESFWGRDC